MINKEQAKALLRALEESDMGPISLRFFSKNDYVDRLVESTEILQKIAADIEEQ